LIHSLFDEAGEAGLGRAAVHFFYKY